MDKTLSAEIDAFRDTTRVSADEIIFKRFPAKILELNKLISTQNQPDSPFSRSPQTDATVYPAPNGSSEPPSKKRKTSNGDIGEGHQEENARYSELVKSNHNVKELHEIVKKECEQIAESIDQVKLWVTLTMPRIEDGDNFGVQVQEECLSELHRAQESAYSLRDIPRQDYVARAKLASKRIKYPNVEDYTLALQEHDEKQIYYCRQRIRDIRNLYAAIFDVLQKNISKLRTPKSNNSGGLY